jgi:hypothetical protein
VLHSSGERVESNAQDRELLLSQHGEVLVADDALPNTSWFPGAVAEVGSAVWGTVLDGLVALGTPAPSERIVASQPPEDKPFKDKYKGRRCWGPGLFIDADDCR